MKTRVAARRKAKKRRTCNANLARARCTNVAGVSNEHDTASETNGSFRPPNEGDDATNVIGPNNPIPTSTSVASTPTSQIFKEIRNVSEEKLKHSYFNKQSPFKGKITRSRAHAQRCIGFKQKHVTTRASGYSAMSLEQLNAVLSQAAVCGSCKNSKSRLELFENKGLRKGMSQKLVLRCNICLKSSSFQSSPQVCHNGPYDVNVRAVHAASSQGLGHSGLTQFCASMDFPKPLHHKPYNNIMKNLSKEAEDLAEKKMIDAASRLIEITKQEEPEDVERLADGAVIAKVAVTIDGTWQRRGHSSKNGVVFIISVRTGEVLDYVVKTKHCHECLSHQDDDKNSNEFKEWQSNHKGNCCINHEGSSDSMETQGAVEMFLRSVERRKLKYTTFVGDGDTDCFGHVKEEVNRIYGDAYVVCKEECVGHVQKRLGSALRRYKNTKKGAKLSDGKGVSGPGRLTDKLMDKMQNFFGQAIRNNSNEKEKMTNDIWAIMKHMVCEDGVTLAKQHENCPKSESSWCKFWSNRQEYDDSKRLPAPFFSELKPIFDRLSKDELLDRCLMGLTQNQNESINSILWSKCPKRKFCGRHKLVLGAAETVCHFNTGCASVAELLQECNVAVGSNSRHILESIDHKRIRQAAKKISMKARLLRRKKRAEKKGKPVKRKSYQAGAFGLGKLPEIALHKEQVSTKEKTSLSLKSGAEPSVTFVDEKNIVLVQTKKKQSC